MKILSLSILAIFLGIALPIAGVETFGLLVGHSPLLPSFEANFPNFAGYGLLILGWLPFVVLSSIILAWLMPKPVWFFAGLSAVTTNIFYFVPFTSNTSQALTLPHALLVLALGWLVIPLAVVIKKQSRPTTDSTGR